MYIAKSLHVSGFMNLLLRTTELVFHIDRDLFVDELFPYHVRKYYFVQ